jgi:glycosyltransferase involved in cell wall biosynthesis
LKILQVHNFYQQPGGEDEVYAAECELLRRHGHSVEQYSVDNDALRQMPAIETGWRTLWNRHTFDEGRKLIRQFRPEIVHCHNTFPLISPAIYYAARQERVPVVQTIHNYRLICPAATLYRQGHICQDCLRHVLPYDGVLHKCYRGSHTATAAVASMLSVHRIARTWKTKVTVYVALTEFAKAKLVEGGLPQEKIVVKPNFLANDPGAGDGEGGFALFVGRLSEEKGLRTLLRAWRDLPAIPLKIAGHGPLFDFVRSELRSLPNVELLGFRERPALFKYMQAARCLIVPSEWYEGLPMTVIEALACGTPVICSDLGSLRELIIENVNGVRFAPGDTNQLVQEVHGFFSRTGRTLALRQQARLNYEAHYTAASNYQHLLEIYRNAKSGYEF